MSHGQAKSLLCSSSKMRIYRAKVHLFICNHWCVTCTGLMNTKTACYKDMRVQVNTSYCNPRSRPVTGLVPCNTQPCPARWGSQTYLNLYHQPLIPGLSKTNSLDKNAQKGCVFPKNMPGWFNLDTISTWIILKNLFGIRQNGPYRLPDAIASSRWFSLEQLCAVQVFAKARNVLQSQLDIVHECWCLDIT